MLNRPYLSLVIPVFNEEANLHELVERCLTVCNTLAKDFEIILVNDGSSDQSEKIITQLASDLKSNVTGVLLNRNYGQHAAVMAGLEQSSGEIVITLDADLQNPPEEIPNLLNAMGNDCDVVGSIRQHRKDTLFRRLASRMINKAVQKATGVMMSDYGCMLRAYRRNIVDAMLLCHERSTFIPVLANSFAHKTAEIKVQHADRQNDNSKYDLWKLISLQFDLLTSMTTFPLRLLSIVGGVIALLGFILSFLLLFMRLIYGPEWAAQGVFTVFSILFIFVGAQFLGMGLLGEYIGRIYNDVRARPRYFVKDIIQNKVPHKP